MDRIKHYYSVGTLYLKQSLQRSLEYPVNLFGWFFLQPYAVWHRLCNYQICCRTNLAHYRVGISRSSLFLYGLSVLSHGVSVVLFVQDMVSWIFNCGRGSGYFSAPAFKCPISIFVYGFQFGRSYRPDTGNHYFYLWLYPAEFLVVMAKLPRFFCWSSSAGLSFGAQYG